MTDLPQALRASLAGRFRIHALTIDRRDVSSDGTQKLLVRLDDGRTIESVFIPDTPEDVLRLHPGRLRHGVRASA